MGTGHRTLIGFIGCFAALHHVLAQNQTGFISLDCGLEPKGESHIDRSTGIKYTSDALFIETGESKRIQSRYLNKSSGYSRLLRSFPKGVRNCYRLNLRKNDKYLIRATFLYGNYDKLQQLPMFDLHIGPSKWTTVVIRGEEQMTSMELIHSLKTDDLEVCLIKTGSSVPFISSLELRPMKRSPYPTQNGSLHNELRGYFAPGPLNVRFRDDVHDRIWKLYPTSGGKPISTSEEVETNDSYDPPQVVMKTAIGTVVSPNGTLGWASHENSVSAYVYFYFAELEEMKANETRVFDIFFNGKLLSKDVRPSRLTLTTFHNSEVLKSDSGEFIFTLVKTNRSTYSPIINAFEAYIVIKLSTLTTEMKDAYAMRGIKKAYKLRKTSWQGDPWMPKGYLWQGLDCRYKNLTSPRITFLNLSSSRLNGAVTPYIQNLTHLERLDLSNNSLTGELPAFLSKMTSLKVINLSKNNLSGSIPATLVPMLKDGSLDIRGNKIVCPIDLCGTTKSGSKIVLIVVSTIAIFTAIVTIVSFVRRKARSNNEDEWVPSAAMKDRRFSYSDIQRITNKYERVLGQGGFGMVYHGYLNEKVEVAVKVLSRISIPGYKQFKAEVELLLRVHHRNLVALVGYCTEHNHLALIYEYMMNGNLREHLSGKNNCQVLNWITRLQIALDAAEGLEYLHIGCTPPMIHRDIKTTNILLDEFLHAKLSDFGLSRSFTLENGSCVSTDLVGTPGYIDPEYFRTNLLSEMSDIFSFGIVLLEIITNQAVIDHTRSQVLLTDWVSSMLAYGDITKIIDEKLKEDYSNKIAWKVLELAMSFVEWSSHRRPKMHHVVTELKECFMQENARIEKELILLDLAMLFDK